MATFLNECFTGNISEIFRKNVLFLHLWSNCELFGSIHQEMSKEHLGVIDDKHNK